MTRKIDNFHGEYFFLSNFYIHPITYNGKDYSSSEHAYQAAKAKTDIGHDFVAFSATPAEAKKSGRRIAIREDWDEVKDEVMMGILRAKFSSPELREKLLATGDAELVEGNWWNDTYWGVCNDQGLNKLGVMLMTLREELKNGT